MCRGFKPGRNGKHTSNCFHEEIKHDTFRLKSLGILVAITAAAAPIRRMLLATQDGAPILSRPLPDTALLATRTALQNALLVALGPDRLRLGCEVGDVAPGRVTLVSGEVLACDLVVDAGGIRAPSNTGAPPSYGGVRRRAGAVGPGRGARA